jgi:NADH-quinone oxidoreductase subunit N
MNYLQLLQLAAPEAIVVVTALLVLTVGLITSQRAATPEVALKPDSPASATHPSATTTNSCLLIATLGLIAAIVAVVRLPLQASIAHGMLVISPLNSLFQIIALLLAFFTLFLVRAETFLPNKAEYIAMILLATVGLMLLVGSEELLMIFIGLELTGLSLYVLTAFAKMNRQSAEAGLKYFLFGSVASAFTLFGLSLIYGLTNTTVLSEIGARLATPPLPLLLVAGMIMTLIGFAFKIAAAPFHLWAPDAYQGAPISTAAFIASGSKVASFLVLGKILLKAFGNLPGSAAWHALAAGWQPIVAVLAALSIVVGNLTALAQKNVRRLLAYSAVAQGGYTLLGLIAGGPAGYSATLFYTTIYAVTLIGAFGVVGFVRQRTGGDDLSDFAGLRESSPLLATCMAIFMLSLAGLPPLAGFFGKFYLFKVTMSATPNNGLLWLVILALLGSLMSLYYYLIVLKMIFVNESSAAIHPSSFQPFLPRLVVSLLAMFVLLLGILPQNLLARILATLS